MKLKVKVAMAQKVSLHNVVYPMPPHADHHDKYKKSPSILDFAPSICPGCRSCLREHT
jgi:hypothetical protein